MKLHRLSRTVIAGCALVVSASVLAQPTVHRLDGSLAPGSSATVTGTGFGSVGPKVQVYDDFEGSAPLVGSWSSGGRVQVSGGYNASRAHLAFNADTSSVHILQKVFGEQDEILLSYRVMIPKGTLFPGNATQPGTFSTNSSWKLTWIFDGSDGYLNDGKYDLCLPTYVGSNFLLAGNDFNYQYVSTGWWSWTTWNEITVHLKKDPSNPGFFRAVSAEKGTSTQRFSETAFPSNVTQSFDRLNVPGWIRSSSNSQPLYDDVYVAVGSGSLARVELADAPKLSEARSVTILPVEKWSDQQISVRIPRDLPANARYVFVTTADGKVNPAGVLSACTDCPEPPTAMSVR